MSLFIEFEQKLSRTSTSNILRCDDLCTEFGINSQGHVSQEQFSKTLFAVYRHDDVFLLIPFEAGFLLNSTALEVGRTTQLRRGIHSLIDSPWFTAHLYFSSSLHESSARYLMRQSSHAEPGRNERLLAFIANGTLPQAKISYKLGGYSRHRYLFQSQVLIVGSCPESDFCLPYQGVAASHFEVCCSKGHLQIKSLSSPIIVNHEPCMEKLLAPDPDSNSSQIQIPPLGLRLEIDFPATELRP